jgi:hypothetical protein
VGVNPAGFLIGAAGCAALIIQGRRLKADPREEWHSLGHQIHGYGILFAWMLALIVILLLVDAFGFLKWAA